MAPPDQVDPENDQPIPSEAINGLDGNPSDGDQQGLPPHPPLKLGFKDRIRHFTWTWFTLTMATGGIANVIHTVPLRFTGLYTIGVIFLILNLVFFLSNCIMIFLRFWNWPHTFHDSFTHPTESLFIAALIISVATILTTFSEYAFSPPKTGVWLMQTMIVLYWCYIALAMFFSVAIYLTIWSTHTFTIGEMTPVWIFPAYPLLLVGPFAGVLSAAMTSSNHPGAVSVIVGGTVLQGTGFMVSIMIYSAYLYRLMTQKLPEEGIRPAMFISIGPSGFTVSGLINMGKNLPQAVAQQGVSSFLGGADVQLAARVSQILAYWTGIWLWGLALWFFFVSVGAHWSTVRNRNIHFAMTWWSFIFPNTAFVTATFAVANALGGNFPIQVIGCILTCVLVFAWAVILGINVRAVVVGHVLWPQKQEDSDSHYEEGREDFDAWQRSRRGTGASGSRYWPGDFHERLRQMRSHSLYDGDAGMATGSEYGSNVGAVGGPQGRRSSVVGPVDMPGRSEMLRRARGNSSNSAAVTDSLPSPMRMDSRILSASARQRPVRRS
ncbi:MAG: hypothetical protein M1831_007353 [Alyxoria varia]|nr:MAG: hypothetical protein M1831_007353 [Alyxoria varia]